MQFTFILCISIIYFSEISLRRALSSHFYWSIQPVSQ